MKRPTLNPDGFSVKGCSHIYAPKGQAGEYAKLAANPYRGCGHKCLYCYVPNVLRMSREEFDAGAVPREHFISNLCKDAAKYQALGITEQVMLSFTTDPYHPGDTQLTRLTLKVLRDYGLAFCTLTKGGTRALRDIDLFRPDRDAFASTLTTLDDSVSWKWERDAALPSNRIATLERFHQLGIYTWVSLEPVFDTEATLEIIRRTHPFVDLFKIGRINYSTLTKRIDWREFTERVLEVLAETGAGYYVKQDLQPYLPEGFTNDKYRPQMRAAPAPEAKQESTDVH
jgi:DNA repair photolyase